MPSRTETLRVGHKAAETDIPFDIFKEGLRDWRIHPVFHDGELAGMLAIKNSHIHGCILPEYRGRWLNRRLIRQYILPILRAHGCVHTAVPHNQPHGHAFVKKFGWEESGVTDYSTNYVLEKIKWA